MDDSIITAVLIKPSTLSVFLSARASEVCYYLIHHQHSHSKAHLVCQAPILAARPHLYAATSSKGWMMKNNSIVTASFPSQ